MISNKADKGLLCRLYNSKLYEDVFLCMAAVYFTAAFNYDFYISGRIFDIGRLLSLVLMVFCWLGMSFTNGMKGRRGFIIAALVWNAGLPAVKLLVGSIRVLKFSDFGLVVNEALMILCEFPYYFAEKYIGLSGLHFSVILTVLCLLLFASGLLYTKKIMSVNGQGIMKGIDNYENDQGN